MKYDIHYICFKWSDAHENEGGSCLGTRRNLSSQTLTEIILQRSKTYVNVRRSVWSSVRPSLCLRLLLVSTCLAKLFS